MQTLRGNVEAGIIKAGGAYGGEWTRDVAINVWNAANLLLPEEAECSLWHVTTDNRTMIGHQYWDQILWVTGAYDHYLATQDTLFLRQACTASANTMRRLETEAFDAGYGLFTGPSVFNDGIAGYEEPVFDPGVGSSYVLDYPEARHVKCLSTNCIYYNAYLVLAQMSDKLGHGDEAAIYRQKADTLRKVIRARFYDPATATFAYLIDGHGTVHHFQEGLGISFAILFGIVDRDEAARVVDGVYVAPYGLPSIYPAFKRFSKERPGRHNVLVWPFVSAFWADAALHAGREERFVSELETSAVLSRRATTASMRFTILTRVRFAAAGRSGADRGPMASGIRFTTRPGRPRDSFAWCCAACWDCRSPKRGCAWRPMPA